jgi:phage terminase large subunit-like protein
VRGSRHENRANLAPVFFDRIVDLYAGTRLGR